MRDKISACIMTLNEENLIERCLKSVTWCDEIVVLDSFSTDRTIEICRAYTDKIFQHEWLGYIGQRNLIRSMATHSWVLFLDADEEVSDALREEIQHEMEINKEAYVGYRFPRCVYYLGRWIRYGEWYPDIKLRLFRKDLGYSVGEEPHDQVVVNGPVKKLNNPLWHYTYANLHEHLETVNRFSGISAQAKYEAGYRFRATDFMFRPFFRFLKAFILKRGFMDGRRGLLIATISAFGVAMKYAKVWEIQQAKSYPETPDRAGPSKPRAPRA